MKQIHILITAHPQEQETTHDDSAPVYSFRLKMLESNAYSQLMDRKISSIFLTMGLQPSMKGYRYLRDAVKLAMQNPDVMHCVTRRQYPAIAEQHDTTAANVEHNIRHAIDVCWQRGRGEALNGIFGYRVVLQSDKPSNSGLIALISDYLLSQNALE